MKVFRLFCKAKNDVLMKRFFRWVLRLFLVVLILPTLLLMLVCVAVYQPRLQQWMAELGLRELSQRIGYVVSAERVSVRFPLQLQADGLSLVTSGDTLIAIESFEADVAIAPLTDGKVSVTDIALRGIALSTDTLLHRFEADGQITSLSISDVLVVPSEPSLRLRGISIEAPQIALRERVEPLREMAFTDLLFVADSLLVAGSDVRGILSRVALAVQFAPIPEAPLRCQIQLSGPLDRLTIQQCHVTMAESVEADITGNIQGLPQVGRLSALLECDVTARDTALLVALLDSSQHRLLPLLSSLQVHGTLSYSPDTMYTNLMAHLASGVLSAEAGYRPSRQWCTLVAEASYADTLLQMRLSGHAVYTPEHLTARLYTRLSDVHLQGLGLVDTDLCPSLQSRLMLNADSFKVYTLRARLFDIRLASPNAGVEPQAMTLRARLSPDSVALAIRSGDLRLVAQAHTGGLPWEWKDISSLYQPHLTLQAGPDNPLSHYLSLIGIAVTTLHAQIHEEGSILVAKAGVGPLTLRGMRCDTLLLDALYDGHTLSAYVDANAFAWAMPTMQLSASLGAQFTWHDAFRSDSLQGALLLSSLQLAMPAYSLLLQTRDTAMLPFVQGSLMVPDVALYAAGSQPLLINGRVDLLGAKPSLMVRLDAREVSLLQGPHTPHTQLYGTARLSTSLLLSGTFDALRLDGDIALRGGTSLHYIYRSMSLASAGTLDDVVTFVDFSASPDAHVKRTYSPEGFTLNLNASIDPTVQLEVLLGGSGENVAQLQGGAQLHVQYLPASGLRLSGKYVVESGQLLINVPLLHVHTMTIVSGSTVQWSGNALNPLLNVTAENRMRTSVTLDNTPQTVLFVASISLTDTMERLGLQFGLSAPENASMQNLLATLSPDERSKLTVALLTTGLYLGEGGTGNLMNTALMGFLQSQLDDISRDTFRSVDVSFGIEPLQDGVSGVSTRTDYSFSVAKRLWHDRIRIVVGGSVTTSNERIEDNAIIDNISIEWRMTPNGNRYLRFFYDKNYESILEGEIRETGVGYTYRKKF